MGTYFSFCFEGGIWGLIVLFPDDCLSIYFDILYIIEDCSLFGLGSTDFLDPFPYNLHYIAVD